MSDATPLLSAPALLCEVTRGAAVESRHWGHAVVVDAAGEVIWSAGDPDVPMFPRSALKPLQALAALARGTADRFEYTDAQVAVTCGSHAAEPTHREAVAAILARIGATEADLCCGPHPVPHLPSRDALILEGREPTPIYSNCSGKHAGLLALACVLGAPVAGYWEPDHPVQREIQRVLHVACGMALPVLEWGVDGCGVPTYRMPLRALAQGFARLAVPETLPADDRAAARRITRAMMAEPRMVRGEGGYDTVLMQSLGDRVFAKSGAEGCHAIGVPSMGIGIAVKVEDGSARPLAPVTLAIMRHRGALPDPLPAALAPLVEPVVENTRGAVVGAVRALLR